MEAEAAAAAGTEAAAAAGSGAARDDADDPVRWAYAIVTPGVARGYMDELVAIARGAGLEVASWARARTSRRALRNTQLVLPGALLARRHGAAATASVRGRA